MAGFDNPISFKKITEMHIEIVEASIRERTLGTLIKNLYDSINEECDVAVDEEQLVDHFGPRYAHDTSSFRFEEGDKILINELVDYVKSVADEGGTNCGLHHFAPVIHSLKPKRRRQKQNNQKFPQIKVKEKVVQIDETRLKYELVNKVTAIVQCFYIQQSADPELYSSEINENTVELHVTRNERNECKVNGKVHCTICMSENRKNQKPKSVYYNFKGKNGCWVMSNFVDHFKSIHKVIINTSQLSTCKNSKVEIDTDEMILSDGNSVHAEVTQTGEELEQNAKGNEDDDEIDLIVVDDGALQPEANNNLDQIAVLYSQFSDQITKIMAAVFTNSDKYEQIQFVVGKSPRKLTVANTDGDGNCLFYSLAHQLWMQKISGVDHIKAAKKLRADTVKHILDPKNFDLYEHQLHERVYETKEKSEIENLATECRLFVKLKLARNKTWGGAETLMAVSDMYSTNIVVFNEGLNCFMISRAGSNHNRTIAVAFRFSYDKEGNRSSVRNHYESVCDMDPDDLYAAIAYIQTFHN